MLSLRRTAVEARALDEALDTQRAVTRRRFHALRQGIHRGLTSPTALASSFAAGIIVDHLSRLAPGGQDEADERNGPHSRWHDARHYAAWALRVYLTRKAARFLNSVA